MVAGDEMNYVAIYIKNQSLCWRMIKKTGNQNVNNTNVLDLKRLYFTKEFLEEQVELMNSFIQTLCIKYHIHTMVVEEISILKLGLHVIKNNPQITTLIVTDDQTIGYLYYEDLKNQLYLTKINCFDMPRTMIERLCTARQELYIEVRCEVLTMSHFAEENRLDHYQDYDHQEKIIIDRPFTKEDLSDVEMFFDFNRKLKQIDFLYYDQEILTKVMEFIIRFHRHSFKIKIHQRDMEQKELFDLYHAFINQYKDFLKKNKISVQIIYTDQYKKKNYLKQINLNILLTIFITIFIMALFYFVFQTYREQKGKQEIEETQEKIQEKIEEQIPEETEEPEPTEEPIGDHYLDSYYQSYDSNYSVLYQMNSDTVGWLSVPNTNIQYPVVQSNDNEYYLNHSFLKQDNIYGWIFMDYRNQTDTLNKNTILYGHDNAKGLMFGQLKKVLNQEWNQKEENQVIEFNIKETKHRWRIFSVYRIAETSDYLKTTFTSDQKYQEFINMIKNRSEVSFSVTPMVSDYLLTLSTCYNNKDRLVVHAYRIE